MSSWDPDQRSSVLTPGRARPALDWSRLLIWLLAVGFTIGVWAWAGLGLLRLLG